MSNWNNEACQTCNLVECSGAPRFKGICPQGLRSSKASFAKIMARTVPGGDGCVLWTGAVGPKGQPRGCVGGKTVQIRRAVWSLFTGEPTPKDRWVGATCGVHRCINTAHLYLRFVLNDPERFWSLVKKAEGDACWEWQSATDKVGYPVFMRSHPLRTIRGNRMAWELTHGTIGDADMFVCHRCDNPLCVRPDHLFLGRALDNHRDMVAKGRAPWQKKRAS